MRQRQPRKGKKNEKKVKKVHARREIGLGAVTTATSFFYRIAGYFLVDGNLHEILDVPRIKFLLF